MRLVLRRWVTGRRPEDRKDPWRSRGNQGPADLDAIVRDLQRKLGGLFGGRRGDGDEGRGGGSGVKSGLFSFALVVALGVWALTGFYIVDEAEQGVVRRFGKFSDITPPGLHWHLPRPIEKVQMINTSEVVAWPYQGSMLTQDENIVVINLEVQYVRTDPEAFVFNMANPEETLQDITASAIREIVGKNDLAYILTEGRLDIADSAMKVIQTTLDNYGAGIEVILLPMDEAQYPEDVQPSVQDVVKAREDRERAIADANTYRNQILPNAQGQAVRQLEDAEGYRAQVIADAEGVSQRFSRILAEYKSAPEVTRERMYLETLEYIYANSSKVLVDTEGGNNLLYLPLDQLTRRSDSNRAPGLGSSIGSVSGVELTAPTGSSDAQGSRR